MYLQPTALTITGWNLALGGEDRQMERFKRDCCIPTISTKLTVGANVKGTCTHVAVQGKRHHHRKTLKLCVAWPALGHPCYNYQGGECLPCGPSKAPSPARMESCWWKVTGCGAIPPKMGTGQDRKKKYPMHLLFKQSALCVIFSPVLNSTCLSGADITTWCVAMGKLWAQEQKLQWDPELNQPPLQALVGAQALDYLFSEEYLSS